MHCDLAPMPSNQIHDLRRESIIGRDVERPEPAAHRLISDAEVPASINELTNPANSGRPHGQICRQLGMHKGKPVEMVINVGDFIVPVSAAIAARLASDGLCGIDDLQFPRIGLHLQPVGHNHSGLRKPRSWRLPALAAPTHRRP